METLSYFKKILEEEIKPQKEEIGRVEEIKDGVVTASGLKDAYYAELVIFERTKEFGLVLDLGEYDIGIVVLGDGSQIKEGDIIVRTEKILSLPVSEELIGRVVDPLGKPLDGGREIKGEEFLPIEKRGPSVTEREPVNTPLRTGIKAIDSLIPIGRGQRELILGDRATGKTAIALDAILNQREEKNRPICIYVACGQRKAKVRRLTETLKEKGALDYTIIVASFADDPASYQYLAPFSGVTIGEYFMKKGKDVLVVYDDLTKQAWAWREISLILRRPPGREAYPGDIFYLHSRLLERAAKLSQELGGGSLTALPIIETQAGDLTAYIPTNVISICDGQIYLDSKLFLSGQRPAIDIGRSVSRVGSSAQTKAMKRVAGSLKLDISQFQEIEHFAQFSSDLDKETRKKIERGRRIKEILKQNDLEPIKEEFQILIIYAGVQGFLDDIKLEDIRKFEEELIDLAEVKIPEVLKKIREENEFGEEEKKKLEKLILEVKNKIKLEENNKD